MGVIFLMFMFGFSAIIHIISVPPPNADTALHQHRYYCRLCRIFRRKSIQFHHGSVKVLVHF